MQNWPILWRDGFVGRVDVKADRKKQCLLLQNLHIETQILTNQHDELNDKTHFVSAFIDAINHYGQLNHCQLIQCNDKTIAKMLLKASQQGI